MGTDGVIYRSTKTLKRFAVIPDVQIRPEDDTKFLTAIGNYLVDKKPDTIVQLGDFADMPSLSSYDIGKRVFEGRRYKADIEAAKNAMQVLLAPIKEYNIRARKNKQALYKPRMVLTLGNHEERILRAVNNDPKLDGTISISDLEYDKDWEVVDFLQPIILDGIAFCHYFTSGLLGRPCTSAQMQLTKKHMSCISGHAQGLQIATSYRADGTRLTSVIAGSCYESDHDYLGPQGNKHFRGMLMLNDVEGDGGFDIMPVSLKYLRAKYGS